MVDDTNLNTSLNFKLIWKWKFPTRTQTFLWKLSHGKLLTNIERKHHGIVYSYLWLCCMQTLETITNSLRYVEATKDNGIHLLQWITMIEIFSLVLNYHSVCIVILNWFGTNKWNQPTLFGIMTNLLSRDRNQLVFSRTSLDHKNFFSSL